MRPSCRRATPVVALTLLASCASPMASPDDAPTLATIADQATDEGVAVAVAVTITDETPGTVTLAAASSSATLVPAGGLVFTGSGATRTLTVTPAAGQSGAATITVTATDAGGQTGSASFGLTVVAAVVDDPPTLAAIADRTTDEDVAVAVTVTITDETPATVTLSATSSNTTLVTAGGLAFTGAGASRTLTVTPASGQTGTTTITITATDAASQTGSTDFELTVEATQPSGMFVWTQLLTADDPAVGDNLGNALAASGDVVALGTNVTTLPGKLYVFRRTGDTFTQTWSTTRGGGGIPFGTFVALDGDYLASGQAGRTVVFRRAGPAADDWIAEDSISMGGNVDISGDRMLLANFVQSVKIYTRSGTDWDETGTLDPGGLAATDDFGESLALDGDVAVVGAKSDDDNGQDAGAAYVFRYAGGTWGFEQKLTADDGAAFDQFGWSVAVEGDRIVVGSPAHDEVADNAGAAYVFEYAGGQWSQVAELGEGDDGDLLGRSAEIWQGELLIGATLAGSAGLAWHFTGSGASWAGVSYAGAGAGGGDAVAWDVAFIGDAIFLGAPNADGQGMDAGAVHVLIR